MDDMVDLNVDTSNVICAKVTQIVKRVASSIIKMSPSEQLQTVEAIGARTDHKQQVYVEHNYDTFIPIQRCEINDEFLTVKYSYVSVKALCAKMVRNRYFVQRLLDEQKMVINPNIKTFKSIRDGTEFVRMKGKMKLEFYSDEAQFGLANGLDSPHAKAQNVFLTFADLPPEERARVRSKEQVIMVNSFKLNQLNVKNPMRRLCKELIADLHDLLTNGIVTPMKLPDGTNVVLEVTVSSWLGDNQAIYDILGFSKSFHPNSFVCRECGAYGKEGKDREGKDRRHIQDLRAVHPTTNRDLGRKHPGVRRDFLLQGLPGLHRWNISPFDIFHDLNQGLHIRSMELILNSLVKTHKLTKDFILKQLQSFKKQKKFYEGAPRVNWKDGSFHLKGKGVQVCKLKCIIFVLIEFSYMHIET